MRMCQQNQIDRRQLLHPQSGPPPTSQYNQSLHKDRVNQQLPSAYLQQKRRVPDEGNSQFARLNQLSLSGNSSKRLRVTLLNHTQKLPKFRHDEWSLSPDIHSTTKVDERNRS
jgi:hypothetical protein